ncbi:SIMPL domain-containing protein [Wenyingzhuangia marina]|uniref:Uncharacterized conserved protein YggE, contains kinase-interacting SIMPL domain n=1 Tax=Wenyingzhuangia marina TaxID=1195760 RepID=A0A1M5WIK5_9FLAO|nr:SIMPL domain-containing protein [Wenyingzhuangia marina]GGF80817.1 SIMPL domain-containing protein [Wenyingzhuangia marina]SHH87033.1 Uncharacterized conserved protein YggE, contains kinase-interacting SIMPL domain [Wenyingzhuangia marina]
MKKIHIAVVAILFSLSSFTTLNAQMISLTVKGEVEVTPDIASTNISITKTSKDVDVLRKEISQISNSLNKDLSKLKIEKKDIQTSNLQINKEYDWVKSERVFKGYRATISTTVTFRNISNLEKIYTQLLSNEDIVVNGIQFDYSKKTEAENEAYVKALNNANTLAEKLFKEAESKSMPSNSKIIITSISNNDSTPSDSPKPMYKAANLEAFSDSTPTIDINSGTMNITKSLTVVYQSL